MRPSRHTLLVDVAVVAFWGALVSASLAWNLSQIDAQADVTALARARMAFSIIETTRLWNARHGGVYVPATESSPSNPYLEDPKRDVIIDGKAYTKVNPAYMTRQIAELVRQKQGLSFHITSLKPIRPGNAPDPWEATALGRFETEGLKEITGRIGFEGQPAFRYMAALAVTKPCLKCHEKQGYKEGDVRGGISVTIPAAVVQAEMAPQRRLALLLHGGGFVLLAGASLAFGHRLRRSWAQIEAARAQQERTITERTGALTLANAELARSNAELENFAYVASHDLQEPLRMMGSYARLIERRYATVLDDEGREFIGYMTDGASRMKAMIDDLLAYSRVTRGEAAFAPVALDLALDQALVNLDAAISESQAEIIRPPALPEVSGEVSQLARLFQNLVGNAIKYRRPEVTPRIEITATRDASRLVVSVCDNGIGVPYEARDRIFMIFQRLHASSSYPGTGIGLAICRRIVERHGGRLWVDDAPSGGACFRFILPL